MGEESETGSGVQDNKCEEKRIECDQKLVEISVYREMRKSKIKCCHPPVNDIA